MSGSSPQRIGDATFAAIDFESAGEERGQTDVPIQIGIAEMRGLEIIRESFFCSFLRTERPIVWNSRDVHSIRNEDLENAPALLDLWPELIARLGNRFVVAHSCGTEKKFLRVFAMHQFGPWVDTLKVARAFYPGLGSHTLGDLLERFSLEGEVREFCPGRAWHDALFDSVAALVLLRHMVRESRMEQLPVRSVLL